jgi:hypothetical protein
VKELDSVLAIDAELFEVFTVLNLLFTDEELPNATFVDPSMCAVSNILIAVDANSDLGATWVDSLNCAVSNVFDAKSDLCANWADSLES